MRNATMSIERPESSPTPMLKHPLARDVAVILAIKTIIVVAAALFVFGPSSRPHVDPAAIAAQIVSDAPPAPTQGVPKND